MGKGIMRAQLAINEARAEELAAAHATGPKRMGTVTAESEVHRLRMLESVGFERKRWYYEMLRDLRDPIQVHLHLGQLPLDVGGEDQQDRGRRIVIAHDEPVPLGRLH